MFKVVGLLGLSTILCVNSEKYTDGYELMNDELAFDYNAANNYDYDYDMEEVEEGVAEDDGENYDEDYDFSEFDAMYAMYASDNDIAFGNFAKIGQFPYTVYLYIKPKYGRPGICTGSIIGPHTILTAHHCLDGKPEKILIEAGTLYAGRYMRTRQVRHMSRWTRPRQSNSQKGYDFGFIYTNYPFHFNSAVNRIRLCGSKSSKYCGNNVLKPGNLLYASGFGLQGLTKTGILKYASMVAQSDYNCYKSGHRIGAQHICTKGGSGNTCGGDSGGPLVIRRSHNGLYDIQVGINSWIKHKVT